jgi:hypothetical protein
VKTGAVKNRIVAIIMVAVAFSGGFHLPASAQSSIGGVKKQTPLGGPVKPNSLGGPAKPNSLGTPPKPSPVGGAAKPTSPVVPVIKPAATAVSPSSALKCPAPPCGAKGPR